MTLDQPNSRTHRRRRKAARIYLVIIFLLLRGADWSLLQYANSKMNPWPLLLGVLIGSALGSTFLIGAIWQRQAWARYVLIGGIWSVIAFVSLSALVVLDEPLISKPEPLTYASIGVGIYLLANVWLIRSKRIQHLVSPAPSGRNL